jgi:hypothetical protein
VGDLGGGAGGGRLGARRSVLARDLAQELSKLGLRGEAAALARPRSRWLRLRWSRPWGPLATGEAK